MNATFERLRDLIIEARPGFASGERDTAGVLQLRIGAVTSMATVDWTKAVRVPPPPDLSRYVLSPGDVLFNNTNSQELVGRGSLVMDVPGTAAYSNHITRLRCGTRLDPGYLVFWLNAKWQSGFFFQLAQRWIGQAAIQTGRLLDLMIPLPPLDEQGRIAATLREQLAQVAAAGFAAQARIDQMNSLAQRAIDSAIPASDAIALGRILRTPLRTGLSRAASAAASHRVLTLSSVRKGVLDVGQNRPMDATGDEALANAVRPCTFYVVRGNGSLHMAGAGALSPESSAGIVLYPDLLIQVDPDPALLSVDYLALAWRSHLVRRQVEARLRTSAGIHKINMANLSTVEVPIPPIDDQRRIAARLREQLDEIDRAKAALDAQRSAIDALPAALLRDVFGPPGHLAGSSKP